MFNLTLRALRCVGLCLLFLVPASTARAGSLTLAWDPSPEPDISGYTLLYGPAPGSYTSRIDVANTTQFTINSLPDGTYYFAVQGYTSDGMISGLSNEVTATLTTSAPVLTSAPVATSAPIPTSGCATPDPFVSLGGGTCFNGGWLPPGMPIPGTSIVSAPPPPPPPSGSIGICSTPDPFVVLGGGTCFNGGWLPPGMPIPGGVTAPAPAPGPAPAPAPSGSGTCATPDPFVTLGGGTCHNGGWLPPGMPIPSGGSAPKPAPGPAPAPIPGTTTGGCITPDPFVVLGGGTCVNGDWLPPGMSLEDTESQTEVSATGTLLVLSAEEGLYIIEGDDGTLYTSETVLAADLLVDGARVSFLGLAPTTDPAANALVPLEILAIEIHQ